jgi:multidrug resistance protein MdtO
VIACVIVTFFILTHRIPEGALVLLVMYFMAQEDTGTTLLASTLGVIGVTVGCGTALLAWMLAMDVPWLRVGLLFTMFAGGLFLMRALVLGLIALPMGLAGAFLLTIPDVIHDPENALDFLLWTWWCLILGIATNLAVQWWLSPGDPLRLIDREVARRLRAADSILRARLGEAVDETSRREAATLALAGEARPEKLLKVARLRHPALGVRGVELSAIVSFAQRLVDAAAVLGGLPQVPLGRELELRLRQVAQECGRFASAAEAGICAEALPPPIDSGARSPLGESRGPLAEMERALAGVREAWPHSATAPAPVDQRSRESGPRLFVPDAFTNSEYKRFAVKGALAGLICYVLLEATDWPGIYTAIITCYVVPLSSLGASAQKAALRFGGAATGGVLGIIAVAGVFPYLDDVGGFWIVLAAGTAVAGWITFGSARISYAGIQLGFAFYKCVLQGYGPITSFEVARDRLIGIALGLTVLWIVETQLWPVRANDQLCAAFGAMLRGLAKLVPRASSDGGAGGSSPESVRLEVQDKLSKVGVLLEESRFEPRADQREVVHRPLPDAQGVFLALLSLARERYSGRQAALTDSFRTAEAVLNTAIVEALEAAAERVEGRRHPSRPELAGALAALERTADERTSEQLAIYRRLVSHLERLC